MSEDIPTSAPEAPTGDLDAMILGGLIGEGIEAATSDSPPAADPAQAPEVPTAAPQEPVETPVAPVVAPAPAAETPVWAGQEEAGRAFAEKQREIRELKERLEAAEREKAYQAGLAAGRAPEAQAKPAQKVDEDPEPNPDNFQDDGEYFNAVRAWDRRQAAKEALASVLPQVEALKAVTAKQQEEAAERAWSASMNRAAEAAGNDWASVVAYASQMMAISPGWNADLNAAADPGKFALDAYRAARAGLPTATPAAPAAAVPQAPPPAAQAPDLATLLADPAQQEAALRLIAAQRAAAGVVPNVPHPGPRGAGSGPGANGVPDDPAVFTVEAAKAAKPAQLAEMSKAVFGDFVLDA